MAKTKESYDQAQPAELAAEWVDTDTLRGWKQNPRRNDGEPVDAVVRSIRRFGFGAPILARREDREVIAGHTRLKAALKLGMPKVPVRFLDLDPGEAHLLALADNKVGEKSKWDDAMLTEILGDFSGPDLKDAGFTDRDIERLGDSLDPGECELGEATFQVIVTCDNEEAQAALTQRLEAEGYSCRLLML